MINNMEPGTEEATQQTNTVEAEPQKPDFTTRYEKAYERFHVLKEKGQVKDIHEVFGTLNYLIRLSGKEGMDLMDLEDEDRNGKEYKHARDSYAKYLVFLKNDNPDMLAALEDELSDFERKLTEKEEETGSGHTAPTVPIEIPGLGDTQVVSDGDIDEIFYEGVKQDYEDINDAIAMDEETRINEEASVEDDMLNGDASSDSTQSFDPERDMQISGEQPDVPGGTPVRDPDSPPDLMDTQKAIPIPMPEVIVPPAPMEEALHPPTETVLKSEELKRTERQEFLIKEIRKEAEKIMEALKKPKNFNIANMDEYEESLSRMQAQRQELFLNIQNNLPRGSFALGWRMTQFMRANKLLQGEAENFMSNVNTGQKPNVDRFKIAEKLYHEWNNKLHRWYGEHNKDWNLDDLVKKKVEKYKSKPHKLYKELNKYSKKLDRRSTGLPEGDFWDVLENFNLLYSAFREIMSATPEAQNLVNIYGRQLNSANTLRKIAETGTGDLAKAMSDYKSGVLERKIKVKIKSDGRKYSVDLKRKGGD